MRLQDFAYELPDELIAQYPLKKREDARLMIVDRDSGEIHHDVFKNIGRHLPARSLLVLNNSKVVQARLYGEKESTGARIEVFLLNRLPDGYSYEVLMRPLKRLKNGDRIVFPKEKIAAEVVDRDARVVRFNRKNLTSFLEKHGHIPLPPYIKRDDRAIDRTHYQTVYADKLGSVAAPTAGLHFSKSVLNRLAGAGHDIREVTLHINYGTFKPVEEDDITRHRMHYESYRVTKTVHRALLKAHESGKPIVAVGTTGTRVIESLAHGYPLEGETNLFIYPGVKLRWVDVLLTNFHLPHSTLLMLVSAFGGTDLIRRAYREAVRERYRFYSYGDAMLII
ncbi:MAG: tRNA preQ1(34) S-adenosylmethionine ribosyltransferase-isomerase QueA [Candidatus Omnitrophica bacterium]|nr:tRNA preQ1(34) S-adenosylmethionine ribosyltransferase-isomerase QueA [Candidatus Omnitrophota bacterium]